jgi:serine/threonine protein kinase
MALTSGSKLGPYEIQSSLGAGGMGEVYSARDTRLDRTVAIKILPEHLSEKPEAQVRLEREARAVSSLNHANICQLYDVGEQNGVRYIVMEHLQGETMADRLKKGPLPLELVARIGAEIGDGLQCAHRSGIVHRDLKPGNIMLTKGGAKILDFGLAKSGTVNDSGRAVDEHLLCKYLAYQKQNGPSNATSGPNLPRAIANLSWFCSHNHRKAGSFKRDCRRTGTGSPIRPPIPAAKKFTLQPFPPRLVDGRFPRPATAIRSGEATARKYFFVGSNGGTVYAVDVKIKGTQFESDIPHSLFLVRTTSSLGYILTSRPMASAS